MRTATDAAEYDAQAEALVFSEAMRDPACVAIMLLDELQAGGDNENSHQVAERVLLEYLDATQGCQKVSGPGPSDVARAFRAAKQRCNFWYA